MDLNTPINPRDRKSIADFRLIQSAVEEQKEFFKGRTDYTIEEARVKLYEIIEAKRQAMNKNP